MHSSFLFFSVFQCCSVDYLNYQKAIESEGVPVWTYENVLTCCNLKNSDSDVGLLFSLFPSFLYSSFTLFLFSFLYKSGASGNSSSESESSSESDTDESESSSTDSEYNRASRTHTPEVGCVWIGVLMCRLCNCIRMDNISNTDFKIILSCKKTSQFKLFWKK